MKMSCRSPPGQKMGGVQGTSNRGVIPTIWSMSTVKDIMGESYEKRTVICPWQVKRRRSKGNALANLAGTWRFGAARLRTSCG
jgi:hypothetical protein